MTNKSEMSNPSEDPMFFKMPLDCLSDNQQEVLQHRFALLAASRLYNDYLVYKRKFMGIGPESYAEAWISQNIIRSSREFEDLILQYFVKVLLKLNKTKKHGK